MPECKTAWQFMDNLLLFFSIFKFYFIDYFGEIFQKFNVDFSVT